MRWHEQVVHVARKDLRLGRWLALVYLGVVAVAMFEALRWGSSQFLSGSFLLVLLGMLLAAMLVQEDSPAAPDAHWMILPLRPSAVLTAKIALAASLLLALPLLAQWISLLALSVPSSEIAASLGRSALTYVAWLASAAALAALTRDLRSFGIALVLVVFALFIAVMPLAYKLLSSDSLDRPGFPFTACLLTVGGVTVVAHQYLTRQVRRGVWLAAGVVGVVVLLPVAVSQPVGVASASGGPLPDYLRPTVVVGEVKPGGPSHGQLQLRVEGASRDHQYLLAAPVVRIHMPDGSVSRLTDGQSAAWLHKPPPDLGDSIRWRGWREHAALGTAAVPLQLHADHSQALARGQAHVSLEGRLLVRELRVASELAVEAGSTAEGDGRKMRVLGVDAVGGETIVRLGITEVAALQDVRELTRDPMRRMEDRTYAIVNRAAGVALPLTVSSTSMSGTLGLVLPGPRVEHREIEISTPSDGPRLSPGWLEGATLIIFDWRSVGGEQISIARADRPQGAEAPPR